jgi:bacterial/archaeal transporter family-2 protein
MKNVIIIGGLSALGTGILVGVQSMLSGRTGNMIGAFNTGFWTNFLGGLLAGLLILGIGALSGFESVKITRPAFLLVLISGALGILIIMGISFSISKAGMAAGLSIIIWGQLLFGVLADIYGWGGLEPIPLDMRRVIGLVLMFVSVILIMPKK